MPRRSRGLKPRLLRRVASLFCQEIAAGALIETTEGTFEGVTRRVRPDAAKRIHVFNLQGGINAKATNSKSYRQ